MESLPAYVKLLARNLSRVRPAKSPGQMNTSLSDSKIIFLQRLIKSNSGIPAFQKDIPFHIICKTYDKFSKFIRFFPEAVRREIQNYLFPVFLHVYMQLILMNRKYEAYKFCSLFSHEFSTDQSKVRAIKDLLQFKSYGDAVFHVYIHKFGFRKEKYAIKVSRSSHDIITTWLKGNKCTFIKEIITMNILTFISEKSTDIGKYLALRLGVKGNKQRKTKVLDLKSMFRGNKQSKTKVLDLKSLFTGNKQSKTKVLDLKSLFTEDAETNDSCSISSYDESTSKKHDESEEPSEDELSYFEAMECLGFRDLDLSSISPETYQNEPQCCDNLFPSSVSGDNVMTDANLKHGNILEHLGQITSRSSTKQQNSPTLLSHGSCEIHDLHKPYCPGSKAICIESKPQFSCSSTSGGNVPKFLSSGSNKVCEANEPYSTDYSFSFKQNTQSCTSSNRKLFPTFLSFDSNVDHKVNEPYCSKYSASVTTQNLQSNNSSITEHIISNFQRSTVRCDEITTSLSKNGSQGSDTSSSSHFTTDNSSSFCPTGSSSSSQSAEESVEQQNAGLRHKRSESFYPFEITAEIFKSRAEISRVVPEVCLLTVEDSSDLKCADIAEDGTFIFCGFSNEIRGWDLCKKIHCRLEHNLDYGEDEASVLSIQTQATDNTMIFRGHTGDVNGISFNRKDQLLLSGSEDKTIKLWSMKDHACVQVYDYHHNAVIDVNNSPIMAYFASASVDGTAAICNYEYKRPILRFTKHEGEVTCVRFHPNSYYVATGSEDETIKLWTTTQGEEVRFFVGHQETISCLAFSPCGNYLTSSDMNGYVKIWDIKSGQTLHSFLAHTGQINTISYNAAGTFLAIGGLDGCLRMFDLQKLGTPVSQEEEDAQFNAALKNSFRSYHDKAALDLVADCECHEKNLFSISFINNNLLMGIAGYR